jgi:site-specific recombinase XerD
MLEFYHPTKIDQLRKNLLADFMELEAVQLKTLGYYFEFAQYLLTCISYFGDWMRKNRISLKTLKNEDARMFLDQFSPLGRRKHKRKKKFCNILRCAVLRVLKHSIKQHPEKLLKTPIQREVHGFVEHLIRNRGIAMSTVKMYQIYLTDFLEHFFEKGRRISTKKLTPRMVRDYIMGLPPTQDERNRKDCCSMLNNYFRYLEMSGIKTHGLSIGIPSFHSKHKAVSPNLLTKEALSVFLNTIDRSTPMGKRTYASILCQADLGLRIGDVASMKLDDFDWRKGTVRIRNNKSSDANWLPLPKRVGEAIADYLKNGRPSSSSRFVFLVFRPKHDNGGSPHPLKVSIYQQWRKAGMDDRYYGTHIFRHYAAAQLKQKGVSIKVLSDILGHASLQTTALYSQVDIPALRQCAQPWPIKEASHEK